jgi:maltooligosyltrehalose trehalohydrolase
LAQFPSLAQPEMQKELTDPASRATFERCKLDFDERQKNAHAYALHRDLLELRRIDPVLRLQRSRGIDGAVLGGQAFVIRYFGEEAGDRLLLVNLGPELALDSVAEPLLAPMRGQAWSVLWSSQDVRYLGEGTAPLRLEVGLRLPPECAVVLSPIPLEKR